MRRGSRRQAPRLSRARASSDLELIPSTEELASDRERLNAVEVELDRCWDLLRQRRALRAAGGDPDDASVRDADVVERYRQ